MSVPQQNIEFFPFPNENILNLKEILNKLLKKTDKNLISYNMRDGTLALSLSKHYNVSGVVMESDFLFEFWKCLIKSKENLLKSMNKFSHLIHEKYADSFTNMIHDLTNEYSRSAIYYMSQRRLHYDNLRLQKKYFL